MAQPATEHSAVWFEIPVSDFDRARSFYGTVLGMELALEEGGPNPMAMFPGEGDDAVRGHIYPGKPAAAGSGITIHLAVKGGLEAAMDRVVPAGGQVVSPIISIPAGRFVYCLDLDGNSFGLFG